MNYIFGEEGFKQYTKDYGIDIDGCYVFAKKINDSFHISSDYYGYKKIFYYWSSDFWVVSNSLYLIANHLKDSGVVIKPQYSQIAYIGKKREGFFLDQLYSLNTAIQGVKLLPVGKRLIISDTDIQICDLNEERGFESYEEGLSYFLGVWIARIAGLLAHGIYVKSDLTGGLDSRAVFAIVKKSN